MTDRDLAAWLAHAERLHPRTIDLSLERIATVLARLGLDRPPFAVLTVGGTNGKGSCVAFLEAMLIASGRRVGAYTSPHLVRYTERVRLAGQEIDAAALAAAFARVEAARDGLALTYFEFGTATALEAFRAAGVEVAVLEVGLGGRLDAVNAVEPLGAAVTSVALDHMDLLGTDRESIGREKAGIFRTGRPAVCGDLDPPRSLLEHAAALGAPLLRLGHEVRFRSAGERWDLTVGERTLAGLPAPALAGAFQRRNAACAIALLLALARELPLDEAAIRAGLERARNPGRLDRRRLADGVELVLDVAHNPAAAAELARALHEGDRGRTYAVIGVLADKDATGIARALHGAVDGWFAAGLDGPRGRSGVELAALLRREDCSPVAAHADVPAALAAARAAARAGDRIVVLGSFHTVGAALESGVCSR